MPDSMMVVQTSTSYWPSQKSRTTCSSAALVHLAVGDGHPGLGHELADLGRHLVDVLHPVVHEEDLALAEQLAADGLGDGPLVVLADVGEDRLAVDRRGVEEA